ncbi:MAG TPA: YCF48-related protein [Patescibacteria group bacterium]|nr:YCF48-related protein [Patescibacteria group bacterium]
MDHKNLKTVLSLFVIVLIFTLAGCVNVSIKTDVGGIYKSKDSGETWTKKRAVLNILEKQEFLENVNINVFAVDPQDPRTLYVGTKAKGLFVSYDKGEKWHNIERLPQGSISSIKVNPVKKHVVYIGINKSLLKTSDALRTWESVYVDDKQTKDKITEIFVDPLYPNRVYVGFSDGRVIKSKNEGASWSLLKSFNRKIVKIYRSIKSNKIFIATENNLFYSGDEQEEWTKMENLDDKMQKDIQNVLFKDDQFILVLTKYNIYKTENSGSSWEKLELLLPAGSRDRSDLKALAFAPSDVNILYYVTNNTLYKSRNGGEDWITRDLDISGAPIDIFVYPQDSEIIYLAITKK